MRWHVEKFAFDVLALGGDKGLECFGRSHRFPQIREYPLGFVARFLQSVSDDRHGTSPGCVQTGTKGTPSHDETVDEQPIVRRRDAVELRKIVTRGGEQRSFVVRRVEVEVIDAVRMTILPRNSMAVWDTGRLRPDSRKSVKWPNLEGVFKRTLDARLGEASVSRMSNELWLERAERLRTELARLDEALDGESDIERENLERIAIARWLRGEFSGEPPEDSATLALFTEFQQ